MEINESHGSIFDSVSGKTCMKVTMPTDYFQRKQPNYIEQLNTVDITLLQIGPTTYTA